MSDANEKYLNELLRNQKISESQRDELIKIRSQVENAITSVYGSSLKFYYAGSYGKKTLISDSYDLDIVAYWPSSNNSPLKDIYYGTKKVLLKKWPNIKEKNVALEVTKRKNLHVDVVPGRAIDRDYYEAYLFHRKGDQNRIKTSIKKHIDYVKNPDRRKIIKLIKLWKVRKNLDFPSFILEQMVMQGCKGLHLDKVENQTFKSLQYIKENIETITLKDPANSNNIISNNLSQTAKSKIRIEANKAIDQNTPWPQVFSWKK